MISHRTKLISLFSLLGPGLLVMLADTDAGSLVLSAQSGAIWGYRLLILQVILIPVLFIAQELTVRLGLVTGMGHGELIKQHFGRIWAYFSVATLVICCVGALLTELSGLAAVGELFGVPVWKTMFIVVGLLTFITWTGSYHSIERIAICLGVFELLFIWIAWRASPNPQEMVRGVMSIPWQNTSFLYLVAGNIGAVIMPWMIFFQQSAVLDKGLSVNNLKSARFDTAIGAIITQIIMASVLVLTAATIGKMNPNTPLHTITEISNAIIPFVGTTTGHLLFAVGMSGAAIVATIVVSLTAAWGVGEIMGFRRSLQDKPMEAPWFYGIYTIILILSAMLVTINVNHLMELSISIEVMNALLLPIVLWFLFLLARFALPEKYSLKGWYAVFVGIVLFITSLFGMLGSIIGLVF